MPKPRLNIIPFFYYYFVMFTGQFLLPSVYGTHSRRNKSWENSNFLEKNNNYATGRTENNNHQKLGKNQINNT